MIAPSDNELRFRESRSPKLWANVRQPIVEEGAVKYNPFRPNAIVNPGMFSGRTQELDAIEKCLFQAKHGNQQNFLIEGERGIGKSSLFLFVDLLASGQIPYDESKVFNFLVVSADLGQCETHTDVVREIGAGLRGALAERNQLQQLAKTAWDFLSKWELLGVKYKRDQVKTEDSSIDVQLVDQLQAISRQAGDSLDGILILIDEADRPTEAANLGLFVKLLTERLTRKGVGNCIIGMAGLPVLLSRLRASHQSSPRVFETMRLDPLEPHERKRVVLNGIEDANIKNNVKTSISDDALDFISHLSEGYPHFIQQFAYYAFEDDKDDHIDADDVLNGAFRENGALTQLGHKYFNTMYFHQAGSENYRKVLNSMASHQDQWISRQDIIEESGLGEYVVGNAIKALRKRDIIIQDETRRGFYKLPTRSFATWINAIKSVEKQKGQGLNFKSDET